MQNKFYKQTYELYGPTSDDYLNTVINAVVTKSSEKDLLNIVNSRYKPTYRDPLINTLFIHLHYSYPKLTLMCIDALVNVGVNINDKENDGFTILHRLAKSEIVEISHVVKLGADINAVDMLGRTPLHIYTSRVGTGSKNILELIKLGANVDLKNHDGETALTCLLLNRDYYEEKISVIKAIIDVSKTTHVEDKNVIASLPGLLLRNNCQDISYIFKCYPYLIPHIKDKFDGATPLHHLVQDPYAEVLEKIELLLSLGADINTIDINQKPLLKCTFNIEVANYLIRHPSYKNLKIGSLNQSFKVFAANFRTPTLYKQCAKLNNNFQALIAKAEQANLAAKLFKSSSNNTQISMPSLRPSMRL